MQPFDAIRTICGLLAAAALTFVVAPPASAQGPQAPPSAPVTVVNTASNPVPVTGSLGVTGPVTVQETFAPGRAPTRYGPNNFSFSGGSTQELVPAVASGRTLVVTGFHAMAVTTSSSPLSGGCLLQIGLAGVYRYVALLPAVNAAFSLGVNSEMFLPLSAGESLSVWCNATRADGSTATTEFRATATGYFVPAVP